MLLAKPSLLCRAQVDPSRVKIAQIRAVFDRLADTGRTFIALGFLVPLVITAGHAAR